MKRSKILAILLASAVSASSVSGAVYAAKEQGSETTESVDGETTESASDETTASADGETTESSADETTASADGETTESSADETTESIDDEITESEASETTHIEAAPVPLISAPPVKSKNASDGDIKLSVSDIEIDDEKAYEDFAMMMLGLGDNQGISLLSSVSARERLTEEEQEIYDIMRDHIAGEDGIVIKGGSVGLGIEFSGSSEWDEESAAVKYDSILNAYKAISHDCAEYLYWHCGVYGRSWEYEGPSLTITFYIYASPKYGTGDKKTSTIEKEVDGELKTYTYTYYLEIDPKEANKLLSVKSNVDGIIAANKSKSPYNRLKAYGDEISRLVSYDFDAIEYGNSSSGKYDPAWSFENIDPWQLINVFDGDPDTNVVCEGYSKAFKYLCDLGAPEVDCILLTGAMDGGTGAGGHMWNNVLMDDGKIYLVDITNADDGDAMTADNPLFMRPYDPGKEPASYLDEFVLKTESGSSELDIHYQYHSQVWADEHNNGEIGGYFSMDEIFGADHLTLSSSPYTPPHKNKSKSKKSRSGNDKKFPEPAYTTDQARAMAILGKGVTPQTYGQKMGSFSNDARNKAMEVDYKFFQAYAAWSSANYDSLSDEAASTPGITANNSESNPTIIIKTDKWISFDKNTLTAFEKSGKAVLVIFRHNGGTYQFLIPAGYQASTLANAGGYAGFLYIKDQFPILPISHCSFITFAY